MAQPDLHAGVLAKLIDRAKKDILADRANGKIPSVLRFAHLREFVGDPDSYFLDDKGAPLPALLALGTVHRRGAERPTRIADCSNAAYLTEHVAVARKQLDAWLEAGGLTTENLNRGIVARIVTRAKRDIVADYNDGIIPLGTKLADFADDVEPSEYALDDEGHFDPDLVELAQYENPQKPGEFLTDQEIINAHINAALERVETWLGEGNMEAAVEDDDLDDEEEDDDLDDEEEDDDLDDEEE